MRTLGQRLRIRATIRATSSTEPALASMLARRSLAQSRCRPQKNIQRQVTIGFVVAMKEAPFLLTMQRIIGGIEVEGDLARRCPMRLDKQIDEQSVHRLR